MAMIFGLSAAPGVSDMPLMARIVSNQDQVRSFPKVESLLASEDRGRQFPVMTSMYIFRALR